MAKAKTFFEQVPVALARQIAAQQIGIARSGAVLCGICGTPVELEHSKTNEFGQAVHGKCYVATLAPPKGPRTIERNPPSAAKP